MNWYLPCFFLTIYTNPPPPTPLALTIDDYIDYTGWLQREGMVKSKRHCEEWKGGWKMGEQMLIWEIFNLTWHPCHSWYITLVSNLIHHHQLCLHHPWRSKYCAFKSVSLCNVKGSKQRTKEGTTDVWDPVPTDTDNCPIWYVQHSFTKQAQNVNAKGSYGWTAPFWAITETTNRLLRWLLWFSGSLDPLLWLVNPSPTALLLYGLMELTTYISVFASPSWWISWCFLTGVPGKTSLNSLHAVNDSCYIHLRMWLFWVPAGSRSHTENTVIELSSKDLRKVDISFAFKSAVIQVWQMSSASLRSLGKAGLSGFMCGGGNRWRQPVEDSSHQTTN